MSSSQFKKQVLAAFQEYPSDPDVLEMAVNAADKLLFLQCEALAFGG